MVHRILRAGVAAGALAAAGCPEARPPLGEVAGVVKVRGVPQSDLLVRFLPESPAVPNGWEATGVTDAEGRYTARVTPPGADDLLAGAATGRHVVVVEDRTDTGVGRDGKPRVRGKYRSPAETPLRADVRPGGQMFDIDLD